VNAPGGGGGEGRGGRNSEVHVLTGAPTRLAVVPRRGLTVVEGVAGEGVTS